MAFTLFPKIVKFFDLFKRQNELLRGAADSLEGIFKDPSTTAERCREIMRLEEEGNAIEREIFRELAGTFITPLDREDIQELNTAQEGFLNRVRAVSSRMGLYRFSEVRSGAQMLSGYLKEVVYEVSLMLKNLGEMKGMEEHAQIARKTVADANALILVSLGELYERPAASPTEVLGVVQWAEVYDRLEQALEQAETLANLVERIGVKNA